MLLTKNTPSSNARKNFLVNFFPDEPVAKPQNAKTDTQYVVSPGDLAPISGMPSEVKSSSATGSDISAFMTNTPPFSQKGKYCKR